MSEEKYVELSELEKEHVSFCMKQSFEWMQLAEKYAEDARKLRDAGLNRVLGNALLREKLDPKTAVRWKLSPEGVPIGFTTTTVPGVVKKTKEKRR